MFRVTFHYLKDDAERAKYGFSGGSDSSVLACWFESEAKAKEYAEALKDNADSYSINFVPKHEMSPWDSWFTVIED